MSDNFVSNPGSGGSTFASDDISSVQYPRIKLIQGADGTNDGDVSKANPFPVTDIGIATNGLSVYRTLDLDETEEEIKTSAGTLYGAWVCNTTTATLYLKLYNATAANVTVGTTTPYITMPIPGNSADDVSAVLAVGGKGIKFDTAISAAVTTGLADNDTGAPATNAFFANFFYV